MKWRRDAIAHAVSADRDFGNEFRLAKSTFELPQLNSFAKPCHVVRFVRRQGDHVTRVAIDLLVWHGSAHCALEQLAPNAVSVTLNLHLIAQEVAPAPRRNLFHPRAGVLALRNVEIVRLQWL